MDAMQPSSSLELDLTVSMRPCRDTGPEAFIAKSLSESPTGEVRLMESILERANMQRAPRRGLQFVRFADDCVIYVRSKRAGDRVKETVLHSYTRSSSTWITPA